LVQQCALSWEVGEDLGDELVKLARRKWRWKRRRRGGGGEGGGGGGGSGGHAL